MRRCDATTAAGKRCLKNASEGSRFCPTHADRVDGKQAAWVAGGAAVGHAIVPVVGGFIGAGVGWVADKLTMEASVGKKRVFVSFDFDNDRALKDFIIGQAKLGDSPFSVIDCSLQEAAPMKTWEDKGRQAIVGSDIVVVMVGARTHRASGVLKEVAMARAAAIPIVQIIGYKDGNYTPVPDAGRLYAWSWDNLKRLLG